VRYRVAVAERLRATGRRARTTTFASLAVHDFRLLWLGLLVMFGASQIRMVASGYLAYDLTNSALLLSLVAVGYAVPMLSLALIGGAVADRFDRRRLVQVAQAMFAVVALLVGLLIQFGQVTWVHLMASSALQGMLWALLVPARQAMIPGLVGRRLMTNALSLMAAGFSLTTLVGPAVGGWMYGLFGAAATYYFVAVLGVGAVLLTGRISSKNMPAVGVAQHAAIRQGLAYIRRQPDIVMLFVISVVYAMVAMPFRLILPVFVVDLYRQGPETLGLLVTAMGVGSVGAAVVVANVTPGRRGLILVCGAIVASAAILVMSGLAVFWVGMACMLVLGVGDAIRKALNQAVMLEIADEEYHGRVSSVFMISFGIVPLGALPAGALAEAFGGQVAGAVMGGFMLLVSLALLTNRRLRSLR
jgi:MFS family permease